MSGNFDIMSILIRIPALLIAFSVHEFSHGLMAYKLGDSTAKIDGRLSLNPMRHVDPIGLLCLLIFRFGWAKPVMVDTRSLDNPKVDMALIGAAGPISNFILAFLSLLLLYAVSILNVGRTFADIAGSFLFECCLLNISLGVFNIIPIPPLDGSKIFAALIPDNVYYRLPYTGRYGMILLLLLVWTGTISSILNPMIFTVYRFYLFLGDKIFSVF